MKRLKHNPGYISTFKDRPNAANYKASGGFNKAAGATNSTTKGNEKERLIRCRHCGWVCDRERDARLKDGQWAGYGIDNGSQRIGPSYDHYYGAELSDEGKNIIKNGGFTNWINGWSLDPDNWTSEETAGTDGRIETEDATYVQLEITVAGPD